jgi:hypothetical protein
MMKSSNTHSAAGPGPTPRAWRSLLLAMMLVCAVMVGAARAVAQPFEEVDPAGDTGQDGQKGPGQGSANSDGSGSGFGGSVLGVSSGEIKLTLDQFGVGNQARLGDWCGIRVRLDDPASSQRQVLVRLVGRDSDGDSPMQQLVATTNPGAAQFVWLYTHLPYKGLERRSLVVTVHEAIELDAPDNTPQELLFRPGRLLSTLEVDPSTASQLDETLGLGLIIGRHLGLNQYNQRPTSGEGWHVHAHELTQPVLLDDLKRLPDRWMGYAPFDYILWGNAEISQLRTEAARAIVDYVQQGGHLIVVLPPVGQNWTNPNANELYAITPAVTINRRENADLLPYRPLITASTAGSFPDRGVVQSFRISPQAKAGEAVPIMAGPEGDVVVVRRLVGAGMVTMIGLDLNQTRLSQFDGIDADVFWHRILGKRGDFKPPQTNAGQALVNNFGLGSRAKWFVDNDIGREIAFAGKSALGALVGFVVFVLYWLVVGPPGYFLLKTKQLHRHSWVAFVAGSMLFTVLAWGAATLLRPASIQAKHFALLDHVYGQPFQRVRMWSTILIPRYGEARVAVGDPSGERSGARALIAPWDGPEASDASGSFPDVRGYAIDSRSPDAMTMPVRSTVKTVRVDWSDDPRWSMFRPTLPDGSGVAPLSIDPAWQAGAAGGARKPLVSGTIVHEMPAPLTNALLIVVHRVPDARGLPVDSLQTMPAMTLFDLRTPIAPDQPLSLDAVTSAASSSLALKLNDWTARSDSMTMGVVASMGTIESRQWAMTFLSLLPTPDANNSGSAQVAAALRQSTHGWDLGRWMTTPCVILVGFVETGESQKDLASPVPLFVDGQLVPTEGRTMVRWVYPIASPAPPVIDHRIQPGRRTRPAPAETDPQGGGP